jgi:DNA-binding protein H-NS
MKTVTVEQIPELGDLPEGERTVTVKLLLGICHRQQAQLQLQAEQLALQGEQIQQLKDEIAILKGEKARPKIKPSRLHKDAKGAESQGDPKKKKRRGKPNRKKTEDLEIHEEQILQPEQLPAGSTFKDYEP